MVLRERAGALDHEVGAKAAHGGRLSEPRVQLVEGGAPDDEHRVTVREAHEVARPRDVGIDGAKAVAGHLHEAGRGPQQVAEPARRLVAGIDPVGIVAPDRHRLRDASAVRAGAGDGERREPGRVEEEALRPEPGADQHEARVLAPGEEPALGADDHPAPIPGETPRLDRGGVEPEAGGGLQRVDGDLGDARGRHLRRPRRRPSERRAVAPCSGCAAPHRASRRACVGGPPRPSRG